MHKPRHHKCNENEAYTYTHRLLWRGLLVGAVRVRRRLMLGGRGMAVGRRLIRLLVEVLWWGCPIVRCLGGWRAIRGLWRASKPPPGRATSILLLVGCRHPSAIAVPLVVSNHHLDIALCIVGSITHSRQGNAAGRRIGSGVCVRRDLDAAPRTILQLFDCRAALTDHQTNLSHDKGAEREGAVQQLMYFQLYMMGNGCGTPSA